MFYRCYLIFLNNAYLIRQRVDGSQRGIVALTPSMKSYYGYKFGELCTVASEILR